MDHITKECTSSWVCREAYCFKCAEIHPPCGDGKPPKLTRVQRTKLCKAIAARRPPDGPAPTTAPAAEPTAPAPVPLTGVGPAPVPMSLQEVVGGPPDLASATVPRDTVPLWRIRAPSLPLPRKKDVSVLLPLDSVTYQSGYEFLTEDSFEEPEVKIPADEPATTTPSAPVLDSETVELPAHAPSGQVLPEPDPTPVPFHDYPALVQRVVHLKDEDDVGCLVQRFVEAESAPALMCNNGRNWMAGYNAPRQEPQALAQALSGVHSLSAMKSRAARVYSGAYPMDDATFFVDGGRPIPLYQDVFDAQLEPSTTRVVTVLAVLVIFVLVTLLSNLSFFGWLVRMILMILSRLNKNDWEVLGREFSDSVFTLDTFQGLLLSGVQLVLLIMTVRMRNIFRLWLSYATQQFRVELYMRAEPGSDVPIYEDSRPIADRSVPYVPTILSKFELAVKIGLVDPFAAPLGVQEYGQGGGRDEPWITYLRFGSGEGGHMIHLKHLCQATLTRESGFAFTLDDDGLPKGEISVARQRRRNGPKRIIWDAIVRLIAPEFAGRTNILETAIAKLRECEPSLFKAGAPREFVVSRGLFNQLWSMPVVLRPTMNLYDYASHLRTTLVLPQERLNGQEPVRDTVDVVSLMLKQAPRAADFR